MLIIILSILFIAGGLAFMDKKMEDPVTKRIEEIRYMRIPPEQQAELVKIALEQNK
jgi:hypothetical protein